MNLFTKRTGFQVGGLCAGWYCVACGGQARVLAVTDVEDADVVTVIACVPCRVTTVDVADGQLGDWLSGGGSSEVPLAPQPRRDLQCTAR